MLEKIIEHMSIKKIIFYYRYSVLVITSFFYILGMGKQHIGQGVIIIMGMVLVALITHYLYHHNQGSKKARMIVLMLEVIGNAGILALSGGVNSPYIWYIINTILIISLEMEFKWAWIGVGGYIVSILMARYFTALQLVAYGEDNAISFNVILGAILVTATVQFLIYYERMIEVRNKELVTINQDLEIAKEKVKKSLDYVMEIYQTIYLFSVENNKETMIKMILDYINYVVGIERVLFVDFTDEEEEGRVYGRNFAEVEQKKLARWVVNKSGEIASEQCFNLFESSFFSHPIIYLHEPFGVLVVESDKILEEVNFIVQLSSVLFKKIELEKLNEKFLINEEQNRIANEIHDSSLQTLFGLSCQLFTLAKKLSEEGDMQLVTELNEMRSRITTTMSELRKTIYGMSWNKGADCCLKKKIEDYMEQMSNFYDNKIELELEGELQFLNIKQKEAIYRMICEGISNASRHGRANQIKVQLQVNESDIYIGIMDNGKGFDYGYVQKENLLGVGLKNIQYLVKTLQGRFKIQSIIMCGTQLIIELPTYIQGEIPIRGGEKNEYAYCR